MKTFVFILIGFIAWGISGSGCRSTKKIQTAITKRDTSRVIPVTDNRVDSVQFIRTINDNILQNRIDFQTFSAKVKVDFEDNDGKRNDFNAFIRLRKDSLLWVSINAALGIEAFRILITPDSVKVLNKLDKIIQVRSLEYIQEKTRLPIRFKELQDLLIGNPVYLDSIVSYRKDDKIISLMSIGKVFKNLISVNNTDYSLQNCKLDDVDVNRARTCLVVYGDYENKNGYHFSTFRKITVSEKSHLDIELQYKQYNFNEELSFPFTIPKNYKQQ